MRKKPALFRSTILLGILILTPLTALAQQWYSQVLGSDFVPWEETYTYWKGANGGLRHDGPSGGTYVKTIPIVVPEGLGGPYFIKSMAIQYYDNDGAESLIVTLKRRNFWTYAIHTVATWSSGDLATPGWAKDNTPSISGYKFVDTQKYLYYVEVTWAGAGQNLYLYQVRVHYGT